MNNQTRELLQECSSGCKMAIRSIDQITAWTNIELKMLVDADSHQIAKVMMDGCNMGIQSASEYKNKYTEASDESISIANRLIGIEERFMEELRGYM